jgi:hypothetical protein
VGGRAAHLGEGGRAGGALWPTRDPRAQHTSPVLLCDDVRAVGRDLCILWRYRCGMFVCVWVHGDWCSMVATRCAGRERCGARAPALTFALEVCSFLLLLFPTPTLQCTVGFTHYSNPISDPRGRAELPSLRFSREPPAPRGDGGHEGLGWGGRSRASRDSRQTSNGGGWSLERGAQSAAAERRWTAAVRVTIERPDCGHAADQHRRI